MESLIKTGRQQFKGEATEPVAKPATTTPQPSKGKPRVWDQKEQKGKAAKRKVPEKSGGNYDEKLMFRGGIKGKHDDSEEDSDDELF